MEILTHGKSHIKPTIVDGKDQNAEYDSFAGRDIYHGC
jgi:hypothetical protein